MHYLNRNVNYNVFKISAAFNNVSSFLAKQKRNTFSSKRFVLKTDNGIEATPNSVTNLLAKSTSFSVEIAV